MADTISYTELVNRQENERRARVQHDDQAAISRRVAEWRKALEEIEKIEAILNECINCEKRGLPDYMAWPARLDRIQGELSRYRESLKGRIADKALERLVPTVKTDKTFIYQGEGYSVTYAST
jgi:hypothetical protein